MLYRIDSFYADKITMTPTIPINGLTENGHENNKTPRLCFSDSLIGAWLRKAHFALTIHT